VRVDAMAFQAQEGLLAAKIGNSLEHFAFEPFQEFERDIKEIASATCGVEHARRAELLVVVANSSDRVLQTSLRLLALRRGEDFAPVGAQWLDNSRDNEPFYVSARRVMRAKPSPLVRVQSLLEKRAKD
jgi:hypothetical protein